MKSYYQLLSVLFQWYHISHQESFQLHYLENMHIKQLKLLMTEI